MIPPPVLEVRLRVGVIPSEDHLRWQCEAMDPHTRELLAMHSHPCGRLSTYPGELARALAVLTGMVEGTLDLEPF